MDKIAKALLSLSKQEREAIKAILLKIKTGEFIGLDVKKLKSRDDIFRIRKGKLRVIFRRDVAGQYFVLAVERRSDNTYNQY